jgi:hypothetical protein
VVELPSSYDPTVRTVVVGVLVVVWVAALVGLSGWVWLRSRRAGLDAKRAADHRRIVRDRRRPERDLERAVREATSVGAVVAVARRGSNPTRVTWSDGSVWFFFEDRDRYLDAQARGMVPEGRTQVGEPPVLGAPRVPG